MLQKLGGQIAHALERAHETEQRAAETADPELKASYQDIAWRYRRVAESFQFRGKAGALPHGRETPARGGAAGRMTLRSSSACDGRWIFCQ
ncbi:MAG: hypothetical protein JO328_16740 [Hyphomicrobiales bacterium]|nr:hypothetical protein [Hyphomicrobiales bacterium]MBV8824902.1 hypothetical protein [Hyphomicrobiales bacterium]MBV9428345.1 hypothetical protein [Bradyrhizobiaceae bacterium]